MKSFYNYFLLLFILLVGCNNKNAEKKPGIENTNILFQYQLVKDWPKLPSHVKLGNPTGIDIDTSGNIFVFHRGMREWPFFDGMPQSFISEKTILMLDAQTGRMLNSWGANRFIMPHGLTVDNNNNVWVTDVGLHQIFKFSHEGELLLQLGEAHVAGNDTKHFNRPTDVAVAFDGSFYVSDGYRNSRVIKFSATGKYQFEWGDKGELPGEFNIPHGICLDKKGNVYVADRQNSRVQVFDSTGRFLKQWKNENSGHLCSVTFNKVQHSFVAIDDATSLFGLKHDGSDIIEFDSAGNTITCFGRSGLYNGPKCWYHDVAIDKEENIYVGDILTNRLQKFKKIPTP